MAKLGVVGYTLRFRTFTKEGVENAYKKIADMGYNGPENPLGGRIIPVDENIALLKKYGLSVADYHADFEKPDDGKRDAEKFGVQIFGCPSIPGNMMSSPDGFKAYAEQMNKWAKAMAPFKIQYHNHSQEFRNFPELDGKNGMEILIENTDPALVMFELDTHWCAGGGADPAQWIRKLKGRIPIVHYKDYAIDWKANDTGLGSVTKRFAEIGQGNLNWQEIAKATKEAGCDWICVEQDQTQQIDEYQSLKMSITFMKSKLGL